MTAAPMDIGESSSASPAPAVKLEPAAAESNSSPSAESSNGGAHDGVAAADASSEVKTEGAADTEQVKSDGMEGKTAAPMECEEESSSTAKPKAVEASPPLHHHQETVEQTGQGRQEEGNRKDQVAEDDGKGALLKQENGQQQRGADGGADPIEGTGGDGGGSGSGGASSAVGHNNGVATAASAVEPTAKDAATVAASIAIKQEKTGDKPAPAEEAQQKDSNDGTAEFGGEATKGGAGVTPTSAPTADGAARVKPEGGSAGTGTGAAAQQSNGTAAAAAAAVTQPAAKRARISGSAGAAAPTAAGSTTTRGPSPQSIVERGAIIERRAAQRLPLSVPPRPKPPAGKLGNRILEWAASQITYGRPPNGPRNATLRGSAVARASAYHYPRATTSSPHGANGTSSNSEDKHRKPDGGSGTGREGAVPPPAALAAAAEAAAASAAAVLAVGGDDDDDDGDDGDERACFGQRVGGRLGELLRFQSTPATTDRAGATRDAVADTAPGREGSAAYRMQLPHLSMADLALAARVRRWKWRTLLP